MPRLGFVHALVVYLLLAAALMPYVIWFANNPDTYQYVAIAHRYADGSFINVVNAYWSPLIIWLLVLPIKIIGNGIIAFKVVQIALGAVTLYGWHRLLHISTAGSTYPLLLFAAIPFLLVHAMLVLTADLLFLCIALFILREAIGGKVLDSRSRAIRMGIMGALWYFAKAFAFPLFVVFMALCLLLEKRRGLSRKKLQNSMLMGVAFLIGATPWILALSMKYGYFTISEAARFNQTVEVAPIPEEIKMMPLLTDGPHHPPPGAISPWESPGDVMDLTPLRPWTDPAYYALVVKRNLLTIYYHDIQRQIGSLFLLTFIIALIKTGARRIFRDRTILVALLLMLTLNLGYSAILVHDRYIWINTYIMLLISAGLLAMIMPARIVLRNVILGMFILLAIKRPVKQIFFTKDADMTAAELISALSRPLETLERTYHPDHVRMEAIERLRPLGLKGPLASLRDIDPERVAYSNALHIAYELGLTYHGEILTETSAERQLQELREHGIRYFAVWNHMAWDHGELLLDMEPPGPRIYEMK